MTSLYTEVPDNWESLLTYVDKEKFISSIFSGGCCFFYDTCSFRYHAGLDKDCSAHMLEYMKDRSGFVVLTRCVIMELASKSHNINNEYIEYLAHIRSCGVDVYIINEEDIFDVMSVCFGSNKIINSYLSWAVRLLITPVSSIRSTLDSDILLENEIMRMKGNGKSDIYARFFSSVRKNKETQDNLGEELIAVCMHVLANIPGESDGKFSIITDDKGAAGMIDRMFKRTNNRYSVCRIVLYSTPKYVQTLYREGYIRDRNDILGLLDMYRENNIRFLGTEIYDIDSREISMTKETFVDSIMTNSINVIF